MPSRDDLTCLLNLARRPASARRSAGPRGEAGESDGTAGAAEAGERRAAGAAGAARRRRRGGGGAPRGAAPLLPRRHKKKTRTRRGTLVRVEEARPARALAAVGEERIEERDLVRVDAVLLEAELQAVRRRRLGRLVAQRVEHREPELVGRFDRRVVQLREDLAPLRGLVVVAGHVLLELAHVHELVDVHEAAQLADERDVLRDVEALRPERRVALHERLHVLDGRDVLVHLRLALVVVEQVLDGHAQVPKVRELVVGVERVVRRREHDLLEVLVLDAGRALELDAVAVQAQELVDHGLVRPLRPAGARGASPSGAAGDSRRLVRGSPAAGAEGPARRGGDAVEARRGGGARRPPLRGRDSPGRAARIANLPRGSRTRLELAAGTSQIQKTNLRAVSGQQGRHRVVRAVEDEQQRPRAA